jgi:hypothetical protein
MAFSVSPSVIVREVDATAVVPAIATPPAAIAGVFRWGPVEERVLITSETELANRFGTPTDFNGETFFTAADFLSYSNSLYVTRVVDGAATASSTHFEAKYPGALGNSLEVSYVTENNFSTRLVSLGAAFGTLTFNSNVIVIESEDFLDVDVEENDILRIGNDSVGYQNIIVSDITTANTVDANTSITEYTYTINLKGRYLLPEFNANNLTFDRLWGDASLVGAAPRSGNMHIVVKDRGGAITGAAGSVLEVFENVSGNPGDKLDDGTNNFYATVLENRSSWIDAGEDLINVSTVNNSTLKYETLLNGADGNNESSISLSALARGYDLYRNANEIDISFILQGKGSTSLDEFDIPVTANPANYIINIVEERRDCVAFISPPKEAVVDQPNDNAKLNAIIGYRNRLQPSSSYWFMDSGYKYRYDKYNDVYRWIPLNGDMAGLCSRVEPWESPAGYKRGLVKNVVKLAFNPNKAQRDVLYGSDVNPVISQVGQGILLFGDKTGLGRASAFDRINVRRLFIAVEKAIATAAQSFLFDFNDEFTQNQFKNTIEPFLRDIQGRRGIIDFRVISDERVNTPNVIDTNRFRANIFIKPARSINIIELTFVATRTGVEFDEIVGSVS